MKILHVVRRFPVTTQTFIFDLLNELSVREGVCCEVLTYMRQKEADASSLEVYSSQSIELQYVSMVERWFRRRIGKECMAVALQRFVKASRPDIVHCHFAWSYWEYARFLYDSDMHGLPLLISVHGSDLARAFSVRKYRDVLISAVQQRRNVFFAATTPLMQASLNELGIPFDRIRIVPNAVGDSFISKKKSRHYRRGDVFRVLNVGRLVPVKGQRFLIEAFARFKSEVYGNAELNLVGEGNLHMELLALVDSLGISESVRFMGRVPHAEIANLMQEQDVYVQPSIVDHDTGQVETFGVSILEAIAVGLPVVVTNTGGMPYLVGHDNRFARIVPEKDVDALFFAMKEMFESQVVSDDNIEYANERTQFFSRRNQVAQCLAVYRELLALGG